MKKEKIARILLVVLFAAILVLIYEIISDARAEDYYVLCSPGGEVNVREKPKMRSAIAAVVFFGEKLTSDGKEKNGFLHVTGLNAETTEGWIYKGLVTEDEPVATECMVTVYNAGKVACRKYAGGKILKWLKDGSEVTVYAVSENWCVTNRGYIRTEFLTINAKVR